MIPLSIATKLQNMSKFQDGSILHLVTGFADFNSLALSLQADNLSFKQNCNLKKETNRQHRISKRMFETNSANLDLKFSLVILF